MNRFVRHAIKAKKANLPSGSLLDKDCWSDEVLNRGAGESSGCRHTSTSAGSITSSQQEIKTKQRRDLPEAREVKRANPSKAEGALSSDSAKRRAVELLEQDVTAASALSSRCSLLKTWSQFHFKFYGEFVPVFPITVDKLRDVAAIFKAGDYRSFPNYVSRIKEEHIRLNFDWTQQLDLFAMKYKKSVLRGMGPSRQSADLTLTRLIG
ncbi:unnamed protein product [Polarella glacialis]|uniref:Uncharacterized protein n=1 Tax=Polarella glacialis TaxID=89957 RepID=A0A813JHN0_POLGL|nr:unnamed protein product [Polarella glacialis]